MAFTKETIRNKEKQEFIKNLKPNLRKDDDLEKYLSFGIGAIGEIAAENIPYINEYLQGEKLPGLEVLRPRKQSEANPGVKSF